MHNLLKSLRKKKENNNIDFKNATIKEKIEYLLKSISINDEDYLDRLELVNKMKEWYIFRYPDIYIDKFFGRENNVDVNDNIFKNSKKPNMEWCDIFNIKVFLNNLRPGLYNYLKPARYENTIFIRSGYLYDCISLSKKGIIKSHFCSILENYDGKNIKELYQDIINNNVNIRIDKDYKDDFIKELKNKVESAVTKYNDKVKAKKIMINCVIYSLIDYYDLEIGTNRALLFAEEFSGNIDIPLIYGAYDNSKEFINYYLMLGGNENLDCYIDYRRKEKDSLISIISDYGKSEYEIEMYKRIACVLKSSLTKNVEVSERNNKIKQERIKRKIKK